MCDISADEYCVVEKWHLLELFSRAAFYAGLCYVQAGEVRGAKSMLLHCLVFCEAFRLRKRFILVLVVSVVITSSKRICFCLGLFVHSLVGLSASRITQNVKEQFFYKIFERGVV